MTKKLVIAVASAVKHIRKSRHMSQEFLAESADLDRTYISGVERGVRNITLDSLEQIVDALDVDIKEFLSIVSDKINELHN